MNTFVYSSKESAMKKNISTVIIVLAMLTGLSLLLYPTVSDYWNSMRQSKAIAGYIEQTNSLDDARIEKMLKDAREYNKTLVNQENRYKLTDAEYAEYSRLLDAGENGIIGYIDIPEINVKLPIYHGTDESVLQVAVGHIAGSSLPVGGKSTHCVLSGHRGLPSAKLFSNIDRLVEGDVFTLNVLNETLYYQVDQILTVEPDELEALEIEKGKDYCTLVTCTPYGVNTHRLLVRGSRIDGISSAKVMADAIQIEKYLVIMVITAVFAAAALIFTIIRKRRK